MATYQKGYMRLPDGMIMCAKLACLRVLWNADALEIFTSLLGHFHGILCHGTRNLLQLVDTLVDSPLVGFEPWQDESVVDQLGPVQWAHAPHQENALGEPVEWNLQEKL